MVVLHPGSGFQRAAGQHACVAQDASAIAEERLQLGLLGGRCKPVDQRVELCNAAWRAKGGKTCSWRRSDFAYKEDHTA